MLFSWSRAIQIGVAWLPSIKSVSQSWIEMELGPRKQCPFFFQKFCTRKTSSLGILGLLWLKVIKRTFGPSLQFPFQSAVWKTTAKGHQPWATCFITALSEINTKDAKNSDDIWIFPYKYLTFCERQVVQNVIERCDPGINGNLLLKLIKSSCMIHSGLNSSTLELFARATENI